MKVSVQSRLRPIRLAFLVPVSSNIALRKALEIASSVWGGQFCAMAPVFTRTPRALSDRLLKSPSPKALRRGYLRAFEPDFIVNLTQRTFTAKELELDGDRRLLAPNELLGQDGSEVVAYGLDLRPILGHLYEKVFQFELKHAPQAVLPKIRDKRFEVFVGSCFGILPAGQDGKLAKTYLETLDANVLQVEAGKFFELFQQQFVFPLKIGSYGLRVSRRGFDAGPTLFYMDAHSTLDVIDYWNLRAAGRTVLPLPKQWTDVLGVCLGRRRPV